MMDSRVRDDFPIDWEDDQFVTRREFFKFMTLASGGLAVGSAALAVWSQRQKNELKFDAMRIARASDVKAGESFLFRYPRTTDLCILVRKRDQNFVAYSQRCTHLSCPVLYQAEQERLFCPCHNGAFSVEDGRVLQGPPPHPLPQIMLEIRGDDVWAIGVKHGDVS